MSESFPQVDWEVIGNSRILKRISFTQAVTLVLIYGLGLHLGYVEQYGAWCIITTLVLAMLQLPLFWKIYKASILKQIAK